MTHVIYAKEGLYQPVHQYVHIPFFRVIWYPRNACTVHSETSKMPGTSTMRCAVAHNKFLISRTPSVQSKKNGLENFL